MAHRCRAENDEKGAEGAEELYLKALSIAQEQSPNSGDCAPS
jgi:hypothetical protein